MTSRSRLTFPLHPLAAPAFAVFLAPFGCDTARPAAASPPTTTPHLAASSPSPPAALLSAAPPAASAAAASHPGPMAVPTPDKGIYPDLDPRVRVSIASWLPPGACDVVSTPSASYVAVRGVPVAFAPPGTPSAWRAADISPLDADRDGIPDQLDILLGGKKVALANAPYKETYRQLPFPGGDIPRDEGVCTDVVVRALRNAGIDLQKLVHDDAAAAPKSYPGIKRLDPNIDHRRVRNLVAWFKRHWTGLPADPSDSSSPWLPGDIVFLDTMNDPQPDHLGVVSDSLGPSGRPLIINSWTYGYSTSEMDLLSFVPVTHRFRVPSPPLARTAAP